jgi:hypothetical protein
MTGLSRLAIAVWSSWLVLLGLGFGLMTAQIWHPHLLILILPLAVMIAASVWLVGAASWRLLRGPKRASALACLLVGLSPCWFLGGHALYAIRAGFGRHARVDQVTKMLSPLGESLMDLEGHLRYPQRAVGDRVTLISPPVEGAALQVAAMDRHVKQLEARLGQATRWRVNWFRGPILGQTAHAVLDIAIGTKPGESAVDLDGLSTTDRHEVAHCVVTSLYNARSDPPTLLVEGWAEANCGIDPLELAFRAWSSHEQGRTLTLRELCGPNWYWCSESEVYVQGGALVNFLLRRFGPETFLRLYTTCQQETFADDCRRILGMSLDELDVAFWTDLEGLASRKGPPTRQWLEGLKLAPGVDGATWKRFLAEHFDAAKRLLEPYEHCRLTIVQDAQHDRARGSASRTSQRFSLIRSGEFRSLRIDSPGGSIAYLAHPRHPAEAVRQGPDTPWELEIDPRFYPQRLYRRMLARINDFHLSSLKYFNMGAVLLTLPDDLRDSGYPSDLEVARLDQSTQNGRSDVTLLLRYPTRPPRPAPESFAFVFSRKDHFAVRSYEIKVGDLTARGEAAYDEQDGIRVLSRLETSVHTKEGEQSRESFKVVERRFGPASEAEFTPERFLAGPAVPRQVDPEPVRSDEPSIGDWYPGAIIMGGIFLVGGFASSRWSRPRIRAGTEADVSDQVVTGQQQADATKETP